MFLFQVKTIPVPYMVTHMDKAIEKTCIRSGFMVQILSLPLPLMCTGQGENEGKHTANSHDLIAAILGKVLVEKCTTDQSCEQLLSSVLYGKHHADLRMYFQDQTKHHTKDHTMHEGYQVLCAYTRSVIQALVDIDSGATAVGTTLDIRFICDPGTISKSQQALLVENAKNYCKSLLILCGQEQNQTLVSRLEQNCKDYIDLVKFNVDVLKATLA